MNRIVFTGSFVRKSEPVWSKMSYGLNFWSKGQMEALYLSRDGYLGAVGAFVTQFNHVDGIARSIPVDGDS